MSDISHSEGENGSPQCEFCGCNDNHHNKENIQIQQLTDKIEVFQRENVMMFTRIMDKLGGTNTSQADEPLTHSEINANDFPCSCFDKLNTFNTLCKKDPIAMKILETRLKLVYFKDHTDIVRNMLRAVAPDTVWLNFSWQGTATKASFCKSLNAFLTAIKKNCGETLSQCNSVYCESRIKSFLRHTEERVNRNKN